MTVDTKRLRELAEKATQGIWDSAVWHGSNEDSWTATGPIHTFGDDPYEPFDPESETAKRAERDAAYIAAANPQTVIALLDDLESAETRLLAVLDGTFSVGDGTAQREIERLRQQLAAMTAARDEACDLALQWAAHLRDLHGDPQDRQRIAELRKVGQ